MSSWDRNLQSILPVHHFEIHKERQQTSLPMLKVDYRQSPQLIGNQSYAGLFQLCLWYLYLAHTFNCCRFPKYAISWSSLLALPFDEAWGISFEDIDLAITSSSILFPSSMIKMKSAIRTKRLIAEWGHEWLTVVNWEKRDEAKETEHGGLKAICSSWRYTAYCRVETLHGSPSGR